MGLVEVLNGGERVSRRYIPMTRCESLKEIYLRLLESLYVGVRIFIRYVPAIKIKKITTFLPKPPYVLENVMN